MFRDMVVLESQGRGTCSEGRTGIYAFVLYLMRHLQGFQYATDGIRFVC